MIISRARTPALMLAAAAKATATPAPGQPSSVYDVVVPFVAPCSSTVKANV